MKSVLVLILFLPAFVLNAQEAFIPLPNNESIKKEFVNNSTKLKSIKSDFKQEKHLAYLSSTVVSTGKFWYKKESKLRWEYTEPFKYLVVVNGESITVKDENNTSIYKKKPNKSFQLLNEILASSVNGSLVNDAKYSFKVFHNDTQFLVELYPNLEESKKVFSIIKLYFTKSNMDVYKIVMSEPNEDSISITFENKLINANISDDIFRVN